MSAGARTQPHVTETHARRDALANTILVDADDGVAAVTLNRPEKRNALSLEVMRELIAAFEAIGADRDGQGRRSCAAIGPAFSAGHDLREMLERSVEEYRARSTPACG